MRRSKSVKSSFLFESQGGMQAESSPPADADSPSGNLMSREHAAAFKKVLEKRRVVWSDYAAAFNASLECVHTKQSQEFAAKYVAKGLSHFCGEGDPPVSYQVAQPSTRPGKKKRATCSPEILQGVRSLRRLPTCLLSGESFGCLLSAFRRVVWVPPVCFPAAPGRATNALIVLEY